MSKVVEGGQADKVGKMQVGDKILSVSFARKKVWTIFVNPPVETTLMIFFVFFFAKTETMLHGSCISNPSLSLTPEFMICIYN